VPVSEVAQLDSTQQARKNYEANKANQRPYITP
jgi:TPP-dependent trihydroxycyclohexane-1,2-dione (THcHDO) dehydratase